MLPARYDDEDDDITHSYLLIVENPPFYVGCHSSFTGGHIRVKCIDFNEICSRHYFVGKLKDYFVQINPNDIF